MGQTTSRPYHTLACTTAFATASWEVYLLVRQWRAQVHSRVCAESLDGIDAARVQHTLRYTRRTCLHDAARVIINALCSCALFSSMPVLWQWSVRLSHLGRGDSRGLLTSMAFAAVLDAVTTAVQLPTHFARTFALEAEAGFNTTTKRKWASHQAISFLVRVLLWHPLVVGVTTAALRGASSSGARIWLTCGTTLLVGVAAKLSPVLIPLFFKLERLPDGPLRERLTSRAHECGVPSWELLLLKSDEVSRHSAVSLFPLRSNPHVCITNTLLDHLDGRDIEVLVMREWIRHSLHHTWAECALSAAHASILCVGLGPVVQRSRLYADFGCPPSASDHPFIGLYLTSAAICAPLIGVGNIVAHAVAHRLAFAVDDEMVRRGLGGDLQRALVRLQRVNESPLVSDGWYSILRDGHPPLSSRIARLCAAVRVTPFETAADATDQ